MVGDRESMLISHRIALGFLYLLLFLCFVSLSLCQPAAHWVSVKFGFWAMIAGLAGYAGVVFGSIWLINRINRTWQTFDPPVRDAPMWNIEDELVSQHEAGVRHSDKSPPISWPLDPRSVQETKR
jgi:hypothetical protein